MNPRARAVAKCLAAVLVLAAPLSAQLVAEFHADYTRQSLTRTVRHYVQTIDGVPVIGGERIEVTAAGRSPTVRETIATRVRERRQAASSATPRTAATRVTAYVNVGGEARAAYRIDVEPRPLERYARWYDDVTGELLLERPLFYSARARVFDVNPVAKLNDPSLRDRNDAASAVPEAAYSIVDLVDLTAPAPLAGRDVRIVDVEAPFTPHADASQPLDLLDRSRPEFEEVNAYFQISRSKHYLRDLGYTNAIEIAPYPVPVDAHAANGTDNSYFLESPVVGEGTLYYGDGGTDDAEDSDIVLHEFAHAIHAWIAPGALTGAPSSQARAIAEGFADYWAFSSTYAATAASGRDPYCIADWDVRCAGDDPSQNCGSPEGADCLRRVDSKRTMADYARADQQGTEYENSAIWSSALREVFSTLVARYGVTEGKRISDTLVIESLFGMPPSPSFHDVGAAMVESDRALRSGADAGAICSAMSARGIFGAGECGAAMTVPWTLFPSSQRPAAIPDAGPEILSRITITDVRAIDSIAVRVDITHPSRGDLTIALVAPDGTRVPLKVQSESDRTADVHATFGIDAAASGALDGLRGRSGAGTWSLAVRDVYAGDAGTLESWALLIAFGGDEPRTSRPHAAEARFAPAAHAVGAGGRSWTTDLRLLNRGATATKVSVVFTPSRADGTADFSSMAVVVAARATARLDDVVAQLQRHGTGALEIASDGDVVAMTRSAFALGGGTYGDGSIPRAGHPLEVIPRVSDSNARANVGVVETAGGSGVVRIRLFAAGIEVERHEFELLPFSHVQLPVATTANDVVGEVAVISGDARIASYAAVVNLASGDPAVFPGEVPPAAPRTVYAPFVSAPGVFGAWWLTDAWLVTTAGPTADGAAVKYDASGVRRSGFPLPALPRLSAYHIAPIPVGAPPPPMMVPESGVLRVDLPANATATAVVRNGTTAGFLPFAGGAVGGDLTGIEVSSRFRTNLALINPGDARTTAVVDERDAAGNVVRRETLDVPSHGLAQIPLADGVASVHVTGAVHAWAAVIDNGSGDATVLVAQ